MSDVTYAEKKRGTPRPHSAGPPPPDPRGTLRTWADDLRMGLAFALRGGREGWMRTVLTAVGVGLGVALLLLTTAIPGARDNRDQRELARSEVLASDAEYGGDTLLVGNVDTEYEDTLVRGRLLRPEGSGAPLPPGLAHFPKPGEMVVSPALADRLDDGDADLLRERLDYGIAGTIADTGLSDPGELVYYAGSDGIEAADVNVSRIAAFGDEPDGGGMDPVLLLLAMIVFVALLMPVAVFLIAAVRFGGERRDRRLAALRLVGADGRAVRRIAAGEALAGALLGLAVGTGLFLVGRQLAGAVSVYGMSVFTSDLNPSPTLALLVAVAVPAAAVGVTLLALRGVVIEPLGVVRSARPRRRRIWWRLLLPAVGLGLLAPMMGQGGDAGSFPEWQVIGGTVLLLTGITALLPWLVEAVVARLGRGPTSWQLAVRRLQLSSGTAARLVNGIAVAVAGAIALQMVFAGVEDDYSEPTGEDIEFAQLSVYAAPGQDLRVGDRVAATEGVRETATTISAEVADGKRNPAGFTTLTVGSCAELHEMARLPDCRDGDIFYLTGAYDSADTKRLISAEGPLYLDPSYDGSSGKALPWAPPPGIRPARALRDVDGYQHGGIVATPAAVPDVYDSGVYNASVDVRLDPAVPDAAERVRNVVDGVDPLLSVHTLTGEAVDEDFAGIRTGLAVGAACVLALIGTSLLVGQLEQLRDRRKLLSSLVAFGTRRSTLSLSVLWQTAIPVALGMALSMGFGLVLGTVLLRMTDTPVVVDWPSVLLMAGTGAGVVVAVTGLSMPLLIRLMRPDGLRTE
ncbi:ABC transporter permease [Streptomyces sp. NBC_01808]|uniref:ABC transporter permease n=1 Tax=Streptomyces sp. NBC_01808 TaxID=2975947 RepID=UPI002DD7D5C1|nr:FtsX-like permease family protein [Streptomyces sp. NBC_01808]WSA40163.1 ABC transporter permease [Streptomyces sp. NBC_01808]